MKLFAVAIGLLFSVLAAAQPFPSKPVRIIVPFPPGGSADAAGRFIAEQLADDWKSPVVVENRPGAGTTIAAGHVAGSPPDGYTLYLLPPISHAASAALYKNLSYDPVKSFTPVGQIWTAPFIIVVHPAVKANTLQELIALARASPGKVTYASSGSGASPHLATEILAQMTGVQIVHVPFKGNTPAMTALLGAQVDFQTADVTALPLIRAGRLRALAITTAKPSALVPGVPTVAEQGVPGFDIPSGSGLIGPAGTPREVVLRINASINKSLAREEVRQRLATLGAEALSGTPEEFGAFYTAEVQKYGRVVREVGIRID